MSEACGWNLNVPLLHSKVVLFEKHRVLFDILVSVVRISAVGVFSQDATHELTDAHVNQLGDLLYHDFAVDLILCLIELKLPFFFLRVEHYTSRVS